MRRMITALLLLSLLLGGCTNRLKEPVTFYYVRENYSEDMSDVIGSEQREASGHREDVVYLLALYLMGPAEKNLQSPLPSDVSIISADTIGNTMTLTLSDTSDTLSDSQYTLACGCLALTCFEITNVEYVTINSGTRSLSLDVESLLLMDLITGAVTEEIQ